MLTFADEMSDATWPERSPYWLIANHSGGHISLFTIVPDGGEVVLPVFGHRDEADRYLRLAFAEGDWEVKETRAGELVSMLFSLCAHVNRVVLDPSPEDDFEVWTDLASLGRRNFIKFLMDGAESAASLDDGR